jgi:MarR family 2-MHQ and catechol resistance regulon transcriptional repressor
MVQVRIMLHSMRTIAPTRTMSQPASTSPGAPDELATRVMTEFRGFIGELRCESTERLRKAGVSMTNLHVLRLLSEHGDMPMSRLADLLDVSLSNATGLVDRMEERALIERVRVPDDRRVVLARLTDGGRRTLEEAEDMRHQTFEDMLGRLDERQLARLLQALTDMHAAIAAGAAHDPHRQEGSPRS